MTHFFDTTDSHGEIAGVCADTPDEVKEYLDQKWADECDSEGYEGENDHHPILKVDHDTGEILERIPYTATYHAERSDYDEHNTHWGL